MDGDTQTTTDEVAADAAATEQAVAKVVSDVSPAQIAQHAARLDAIEQQLKGVTSGKLDEVAQLATTASQEVQSVKQVASDALDAANEAKSDVSVLKSVWETFSAEFGVIFTKLKSFYSHLV